MMSFLLYGRTKPFCPFCERAKQLLKIKGFSYKEFRIEDPYPTEDDVEFITKDDLLEKAPGAQTVPQIWMLDDGKETYIGGYTQLEKIFSEID